MGHLREAERRRRAAGSLYKSGKSRNWLKTINSDFVRT